MEKLDLKKQMKAFWSPPSDRFVIVDVPRLNFLMVDGEGDPNTAPAYMVAMQWLYTMSYAIKFASKAAGTDYVVAPLEGLWWAEDMEDFATGRRDRWKWTSMILQPDVVGEELVAAARTKAEAKLGEAPQTLRFASFDEGLSVQILHVGPFNLEGPTIRRLHEEFLPANGLRENGHHHEIYLSDMRRTAPDKLRTVIRQPVRRT